MSETTALKILVVEDDMIVGTHISMVITQAGYEVIGLLTSGESALEQLKISKPDLILMDISLKGELDGIETSRMIYETSRIPVIFLTANSDPATFERAKGVFPYAFISKPFKPVNLVRAIELVVNRIADEAPEVTTQISTREANDFLKDRIFVRDKDRMVKVNLTDIHFVQAERNYCRLFTEKKEYLLSLPLKTFETKIKSALFERVHRSYLVNVSCIDSFDEFSVYCLKKTIPISPAHKENLYRRLRKL